MVVEIEGKGRGVVSTRNFKKKEFLCEYTGECISEAKGRETAFLMLAVTCTSSHLMTVNAL